MSDEKKATKKVTSETQARKAIRMWLDGAILKDVTAAAGCDHNYEFLEMVKDELRSLLG